MTHEIVELIKIKNKEIIKWQKPLLKYSRWEKK
jgi:hypothetical protein